MRVLLDQSSWPYRGRARTLALATLTVLSAACGGASRSESTSPVREPSQQERREIAAVTKWEYAYESDPVPYRPSRIGVRLHFARLHPKVVRIRVSRTDPRFAVSVVELRDALGRRRPGTVVRLLERVRGKKPAKRLVRWEPPWAVVAESGIGFPLACTRATPKAVQDLVCPDPWSVLDYPRPRIRLNTTVRMRLRTSDLHAVDWRHVVLPGAACGATRPVRITGGGDWGDAFIRSAVRPWWPAMVVVTGWDSVRYGDLDGDGRGEAVLNVVCSNAGGTAAGQLGFSSVVFAARGRWLQSIGVITPRQPLDLSASHAPAVRAEIRRGKVVAHEAWYGPNDGSCCASGRAKTFWTYANGRLRPSRTIVERKPRR
jgi:hypothetical protein